MPPIDCWTNLCAGRGRYKDNENVDLIVMLKPIYTFLFLLILQTLAYAQDPQQGNRDKIAAVLALQPAETSTGLKVSMTLLEAFSPSEIADLLLRLRPPGQGNNAAIEYATNSYSYYVMQPGKSTQRATFVKGTLMALETIKDNDNRGYLIQLLQNAADDTAIEALSDYLNDPYLSEKAARALARIDTEPAGRALLDGLAGATGVEAIQLINALGFMAYKPAESAIIAYASLPDTAMRRTVFFALSRLGSNVSGAVLEKAARDAAYAYEPTQATGAYLNYAHRLQAEGNAATAAKIASRVFKGAERAGQTHTRGAALALLTAIHPDKQKKTLIRAAKDDDIVYRNSALRILAPQLNDGDAAQLVRGFSGLDEEVQVDLLRFLGKQKQQSVLPEVKHALQSTSPLVRIAAINAFYQLDAENAVPELMRLLPTSEREVSQSIQEVLMTTDNEQLPQLLMDVLAASPSPETAVIILELLAHRGVGEAMPAVIARIQGDAPTEVKAAAFSALPQLARPEDLKVLLQLLSRAGGEEVSPVQQAITIAVNRSESKAELTEQVISALHAADAPQQAVFFPVLSGIGGNKSLAVVLDNTENSDPELRNAAVLALAAWTTVEALPHLVDLSRRVTDAGELDAVVKGLVRLVGISDAPAPQKVLLLRDAFEVARTSEQKEGILRALEANKTYNAMLFAGRFLDDEQLKSTAANTVMNIALENRNLYGKEVTRLLDKVSGILSGSESSYLRAAIRKHLAELPEDAGWTSLLGEDNLSGWKGLVGDPIKRRTMSESALVAAQQRADEQMHAGWYVKGGILHFRGSGNNIVTEQQYSNLEMLIDWKLDKKGKDGDAGVYLRGTPQVQIWDTSRINVGAQVGSGGLYNNQTHESKPLTVADNPLGEWNTFYIKMIDDRVTVYLNGILVTDNVVLENYWDRSQPIFPSEQIELQAHGTQVSYRDIHIRELPAK